MNDSERAQWVENEEDLYIARRQKRMSVTTYVRQHRAMLDSYIKLALTHPSKRPESLRQFVLREVFGS